MSKRSQNQAKKHRDRAKNKRQGLLRVKASPKDSSRPSEIGKDDADPRTEVGIDELEAIIACSEKGPLSEQDRQLLLSAAQTLRFLTAQLEKKSISIAALKKLLFGASTETSKNLAWFTKVAIWVAARLTCFRARARAQRSGTRNLDRREADYEYD